MRPSTRSRRLKSTSTSRQRVIAWNSSLSIARGPGQPAASRKFVNASFHSAGVCRRVGNREASARQRARSEDRKHVVEGKGGSVRVDHGGRRIIKNKPKHTTI